MRAWAVKHKFRNEFEPFVSFFENAARRHAQMLGDSWKAVPVEITEITEEEGK